MLAGRTTRNALHWAGKIQWKKDCRPPHWGGYRVVPVNLEFGKDAQVGCTTELYLRKLQPVNGNFIDLIPDSAQYFSGSIVRIDSWNEHFYICVKCNSLANNSLNSQFYRLQTTSYVLSHFPAYSFSSLIDLMSFQGVKVLISNRPLQTQRIIEIIYWTISIISFAVGHSWVFVDWHTWPKSSENLFLRRIIVIIYLSKILVTIFLLLDDIIRTFPMDSRSNRDKIRKQTGRSRRNRFFVFPSGSLAKFGFIVGSIPFLHDL